MMVCKIQQPYRALCKLAYLYKLKKAKKVDISTDLYGNDLDCIDAKLKMNLILQTTLYEFRLSDLITIIQNNLTNAPDFFADPSQSKNPYTNIPFLKSDLYNIYFRVKNSSLNIPTLFSEYFKVQFKIKRFLLKNEVIIRNYSIVDFIQNSSTKILYAETILMLKQYKRYTKDIHIDNAFNKQTVVDKFKLSLLLYLKTTYSFGQTEQIYTRSLLIKGLTAINKNDPSFGKFIDITNLFNSNKSTFVLDEDNDDLYETDEEEHEPDDFD